MFEKSSEFYRVCSKLLGDNFNYTILKGGINNPTFLISNYKCQFVLKFIKDENQSFNRYLAEKEFLLLIKFLKIKNAPKLIDFFDDERILILEYIKPDTNKIDFSVDINKIQDCIIFLNEINSKIYLSRKIISQNASDSYLNLTEHIQNIDSRIKKFEVEHLPNEYRFKSNNLLIKLKIIWEKLQFETQEIIYNNSHLNEINKKFLIVSPSDFGFHNVIIKNKKCYFIDFEFSGWDDPGKLYCDFIHQPNIQIPLEFHGLILEKFISNEYLKLYRDRIPILEKLLQFKWLTIKNSFFDKYKYSSNNYNSKNLQQLYSK